MPKLSVEVTEEGRALIIVNGTPQTYVFERQLRAGGNTNITTWMQGATHTRAFGWEEEHPFLKLQEKLTLIGDLYAFKHDVLLVVDGKHSEDLRSRALARAARTLGSGSYAADIAKIDWSKEKIPTPTNWDLVPGDEHSIAAIFDKIKRLKKS